MTLWNKLSLRTKFMWMIGIVTMLLGASSMVGMSRIYNAYREDNIDLVRQSAEKLDSALQAQFFERYGDVQAFAANPFVFNLDSKEIPAALDTYVRLYGIYDLILVVDKNGRYVASNTKDSSGKDVNQAELGKYDYAAANWFKAAMSGNTTDDKENGYSGTFFESVDLDPVGEIAFKEKRPMYGFTSVIKNSKGEVVGAITNRANSKWVDFEFKQLHKSLKESGFPGHGIVLLNHENKFLALLDEEVTKTEEVSYDPEKVLFKRDLVTQFPNAAEQLKQKKSDSFSEEDKEFGGEHIIGFRHMQGAKWISSIGWNLVIYEEEAQAVAAAVAARSVFYISFFFGSLIAMAIGIWFGLSLSKKISSITEILGQNSGELSEASGKVAISSTQLSEGSTEQAAALQQTVAAVDEISAMVDKNAEAANRSKDASAHSRDAAMKGRTNVESMIQAIAEIGRSNDEVASQMENSNQQLSEITRMITDIGNKTKVINEIVFQTKLLSFNASVEAARAGEYGKGFAVVAEEVGNLAQMSGNAAKEITELLDQSVTKVQSIVNDSKSKVDRLMSQSQEKVQNGHETAKNCNDSLDEILNQVSSVDSLVSEIAVASQEQATGIREIAKAVAQMESVTQQNSSVAEASSVAAEQLSSQSVQLNQLVQDLRVIVAGNNKEPKNSQPPVERSISKVVGLKQFKKEKQKKEKQKKAPVAPAPTPASAFEAAPVARKVSGDDFAPDANDPGFEE